MAKKRVKRVKKRNILLLLIILVLLGYFVNFMFKVKIKNIYIIDNKILSDNTIINEAGLSDYPSFLLTSSRKIKNNLKQNPYIKSIRIKKTYNFKLYIYIEEYKVLGIDNRGNLIFNNGTRVVNNDGIYDAPTILNDISEDIYDNFIKKFNMIDDDVYKSISQIEYVPVEVDKERFLLYMDDGNNVYITLSRIKKMNKYYDIESKLEGKKGIIYLDSGNYVEVKN